MPLYDLAYGLQATFGGWVASFDLPLAALAWVTVAGGALGLHLLLRGVRGSRFERRWALAVGLVALGCHLQDIGVTLAVTPDLAIEANPLWRAVLARAGLPVAIAYGLTGKLLLALPPWPVACVVWVGLAAGVWAWWTWISWVRWRLESRPGVQRAGGCAAEPEGCERANYLKILLGYARLDAR